MNLTDLAISFRRAYELAWRAYRLARAIVWPEPKLRIASFRLEVASACNARCIFCIYPLIARERGRATMLEWTFRKALELVAQTGQTALDFTPVVGDPLLDPDLGRKLIEARAAGMQTQFTSNLIALSDHPDFPSWKLNTLRVSISQPDGFSYVRMFGVNRWEQVSANLALFLERSPETRVVVQVRNHEKPSASASSPFVAGILKRFPQCSVEYTALWENWNERVSDPGAWTDYMRSGRYWNPIIPRPCENLKHLLVHADGRISACPCRPVATDLIIGHVETSNMADLLAGAMAIQQLFRDGNPPESCSRCSFYCPS